MLPAEVISQPLRCVWPAASFGCTLLHLTPIHKYHNKEEEEDKDCLCN